MQYVIEKEKKIQSLLCLITCIIVVLHLLTIYFPPVNLEFAFISATKHFQPGNRHSLDIYFSYEANTLGVPLFAVLVHKIFPFIELAISPRFSSILGVPVLGYASWVIARRLDIDVRKSWIVVLLILTNPLVWVYSQRGTADFLPVAMGFLAIAILISRRELFGRMIAAIILGLACTLKPHAAFFLVISIVYLSMENTAEWKKRFATIMLFVVLVFALPTAYFLYIKSQYGFWFLPHRFAVLHQITSGHWGRNILAYATYLVLLVLPFSALVFYGTITEIPACRRWKVWLGFLILAAMGVLIPGATGEMNFGPLDRYIEPRMLALLAGLGVSIFCVMVYQFLRIYWHSKNSMFAFSVVAGLVLGVVVLSFSRPAQRYLLFMLPALYLLIFALRTNTIPRWIYTLTFIGHILLSGYATVYQWVVGKAAQDMVNKIEAAGLLSETLPGPIVSHVGDRFFGNDPSSAQFKVILGIQKNALMVTKVSAWNLVSRTYSVVRLPTY